MIDFSTLQGLTIPEGVVTQITDASGNVLWALSGGDTVILEVEKITSDTYAAETTYTGEEFILLDIYPKTNGTVSVTYGGLTKTITDTSGAEEPNAQQVYFGTFNGVSDEVETPASGTLTIEGDYVAFGCGSFVYDNKSSTKSCSCITAINKLGSVEKIPNQAFNLCARITSVSISKSATYIGDLAFNACTALTTVAIPDGVQHIGSSAFRQCPIASLLIPSSVATIGANPFSETNCNNFLAVDSGNTAYKVDGGCLIEIETNTLISGFNDSTIPTYVTKVEGNAFAGQTGLTSVTIPTGVTEIGLQAFYNCTGLTSLTLLPTEPPTLGTLALSGCSALTTITVPAGCGDTYKAAEGWSEYADYITEAS